MRRRDDMHDTPFSGRVHSPVARETRAQRNVCNASRVNDNANTQERTGEQVHPLNDAQQRSSPAISHPPCPSPHAPAFTLLETLAALAMMAIVALALYSAFGTAFSAQRRTHERLAPARIAEQTLTVVCDDLSAALPPRGVFSGPMTSTDETGVAGEPADTLRFYVHREPVEWKEGDAPAGDICELYFHLETMADGQRQQLVREIKANPLVTQDPQPRRTVIARHIRSFDLRFYDGSEWLDVWDSTQQGDRLPLAVEINLMLEEMKKPNALADADEQLLPKVHARMVRLTAAEQPEENLFRGLENPFSP